jgi:hypothetical protein
MRGLAVAYFLAYAVVVTWPGALPFNRVRPLVLGLPFSMAWIAFWIVGAGLVLWALDRTEARYRTQPPAPPTAAPASGPDARPAHHPPGSRGSPTTEA